MVIQAESLFTILSIILSGIAIGFSILTVWLSLYFHGQNSKLYASLNEIVFEIGKSTKVTEITSRDLISPIVRTISDFARANIDHLRSDIMRESAKKFEQVLKDAPEREKQEILGKLAREVDSGLSTLKYQLATIASSLEKEPVAPAMAPVPTVAVPIPGSPSFNWMPFVRRIRDLEAHNKFLAVRMLKHKAFCHEPENLEALQIAIDREMLLTYRVDNPKNARFPALACRLNREHPVIKEILQAIGEKSPKQTVNGNI